MIEYSNGLSATSSFAEVFEDYIPPALGQPKEEEPKQESGSGGSKKLGGSTSAVIAGGEVPQATKPPVGPKKEALFSYTVTKNSLLLKQLMREANDINAKRFPAAATFILRNLVESLLKEIILNNGLNKQGKLLMLADVLSLVIGSKGVVDKEDLKILKDFNNQHLSYLNLGAHGNVVPNLDRLMSARDSIDIFVKKHI